MYFKRVEMQGFKSFADPASIEFQDGITCIVGPNGSGKSNISDALKWVLGEQSPRALRGGKMEEVIFAGTAARKPKGMAEVTLVMDNSESGLPIDYSEVALRRRMYRSGESEYFINNSRCRLRDIRELIMDTGIGVDGYSIISQGEIMEIVGGRPESRRELFEAAAGIVKYRARKAESERKLGAASVNLERVEDIIGEVESRLGGLREDSEKAREYLLLRDKYRELEINITLKNIEVVKEKNEYIAEELAEISGGLDRLRERRAALDGEIGAERVKNEALEQKGNEIRDRLMASAREISEIRGRARLGEEKKLTLEKDKKRLSEEIAALEVKIKKEEENAASLAEKRTGAAAELVRLNGELAEKLERAGGFAGALNAKTRKIDGMKDSLYDFQRERASKESEAAGAAGFGETLERRRKQILEEKDSADRAGAEIADKLKAAAGRGESLEEALASLEEKKNEAGAGYLEYKKRAEALGKEQESARMLFERLLARKKTIEEMESNYEGYSFGVRSVMRAGIPGLHGVVADLMEAPAGFETAVETALGAAVQNVVCEDDGSAKAAIEHLKEHRAGRLTFLPVRSIRPQMGKKDESCASETGFQGFAVDRIRFDERYRSIFEYLLGRVVIIDSLENAVRASKKNRNALRFVTLDGEVVNASGAMTGGAYKNKTAGFLERKGEIAKLSEKLAELEAGRSDAGERLALLNRRVSGYSDEAGRAERDYREKEIEKISVDNEIMNLEGQQAELLNRRGKWEKEIESVVGEQKRSGETAERLRGEIVDLAAKEAEFEHKIELLAAECETDKAELAALNESVTETRLAAGAAESEKHNNDQAVLRVQTGVAELREEKQSREDAYKDLLGEEAKLCSGGTDLEGVAREKEQEQAELERLLADIRERRAEISQRMEEADAGKNRLEAELEAGQNRKYESEVRQAKNEARLDSLKSRLWDEFEISYVQAIAFRKAEFAASSAVKESREIKNRLNELGEVNVGAVREYETVNERCAFLKGQRADLVEAMASLRKIIEDMDRVIVTGFRESFNKIAENFSESFHMLFGGGKGEIRLEDEKNPLECGVEINAQPPGKKLQNMNLLSGGEKTMTAIALMFAILKAKPAPFCVLDEVEAALDESNICRFAGCLASFKETRFAIVTHQKATMEYADALYGVTMPEQGISRVISLRLGDAETDEFARRL